MKILIENNSKAKLYKINPIEVTFDYIKEINTQDKSEYIELDNSLYYMIITTEKHDDYNTLKLQDLFVYPNHMKNLVSLFENKISKKLYGGIVSAGLYDLAKIELKNTSGVCSYISIKNRC